MTRTLAQVEYEIRRSRNAMDASTLSGRSRTEALIAEADRLRNTVCPYCGMTGNLHKLDCPNSWTKKLDTSQLGRIAIDPNDDRIRADMVREAMERTCDDALFIASCNASDEALSHLYRMLKS